MPDISDISFGIGTVSSATARPDAESITGHSLLADEFQITSEGRVVRSHIGLSFGVRFRLADPESDKFAYYQQVVTHPRMTNPDTRIHSNGWSEVLVGSNNDRNFTFYTFEYEWERVAGEWIFEYLTLDDVPLAKICFEVS
jgi:hypothetical protein